MRKLIYALNYLLSAVRLVLLFFRPSTRHNFIRSENVRNSPLYDDVCRWQKKQIKSMSYEDHVPVKNNDGKIDLSLMRKIHRNTLVEVGHKVEGMWEVSTDTLIRGKGISLDQAIVIMHRLRDAGFPDSSIGVVSVQIGKRRHSFAIVQDREDDFWILDNGFFLAIPVRAGTYLGRRSDIQILIGFNFFDTWSY